MSPLRKAVRFWRWVLGQVIGKARHGRHVFFAMIVVNPWQRRRRSSKNQLRETWNLNQTHERKNRLLAKEAQDSSLGREIMAYGNGAACRILLLSSDSFPDAYLLHVIRKRRAEMHTYSPLFSPQMWGEGAIFGNCRRLKKGSRLARRRRKKVWFYWLQLEEESESAAAAASSLRIEMARDETPTSTPHTTSKSSGALDLSKILSAHELHCFWPDRYQR